MDRSSTAAPTGLVGVRSEFGFLGRACVVVLVRSGRVATKKATEEARMRRLWL
jgi:hypothetical protein